MAAKPTARVKATPPIFAPKTPKEGRLSVLTKPQPAAPGKTKPKKPLNSKPTTSTKSKDKILPSSKPPQSAPKSPDGQFAPIPKTLPLPIDEELHKNIVELANRTDQPCRPQSYRGGVFPRSDAYILLHEEEQHLANQIAFLAQTESGAEAVMAVTIEECHRPPALRFRLASNGQRPPEIVERLQEILEVVEEYSLAGYDREAHHSRMFEKVVKLSQNRLFAGITASQKTNSKNDNIPLYIRVSTLISTIQIKRPDLRDLYDQICLLRQALVAVSQSTQEHRIERLKDAVTKSFQVSTIQSAQSLHSYLKLNKFSDQICNQRTVLEIDKISRYWEVCNDVLRFSQRRKCRGLFSNVSLEYCPPCPASKPTQSCHVHAEVQLVLFHEQYPKQPPPRAIGSSKSACFLCDLFIQKHGRFRTSHSYKRLDEKWTIPSVTWMTPEQMARYEGIAREMNAELVQLISGFQGRVYGPEIERRRYIFPPPEGTDVSALAASHDPTPRASSFEQASLVEVRKTNEISPKVFHLQDLPINTDITASTSFCKLLVGNSAYLFDLQDVQSGQLLIEESRASDGTGVDVRRLSQQREERFVCGATSRTLTILVHESASHRLRITFIWKGQETSCSDAIVLTTRDKLSLANPGGVERFPKRDSFGGAAQTAPGWTRS